MTGWRSAAGAARDGLLARVAPSTVAVATQQPQVVLSFDDGPTPGVTDALLPVLDQYDAHATFFVLGSRAGASPGLVAEVLAAGHEVAVHGPDHLRLTHLARRDVQRRTADASHRLEDLCQRPMRWFRPPYGAQSLGVWRAVRRASLEPVLWTATFNDWWDPVGDRLELALADTRPGVIVLAHDGYAGPDDGVDDGPEPVLDRPALLASYLERITDRGLRGVSLGAALEHGSAVHRAWLRG